MAKERSVRDVRALGDVADGNRLIALFQRERDQRLRQQILCAPDSPVLRIHVPYRLPPAPPARLSPAHSTTRTRLSPFSPLPPPLRFRLIRTLDTPVRYDILYIICYIE